MNIHLRPFALEDFEQIAPLFQELHEIHVAGRPDIYRSTEHAISFDAFKDIVENNHSIAVLAEAACAIVGFCILESREVQDSSLLVSNRKAYMPGIRELV